MPLHQTRLLLFVAAFCLLGSMAHATKLPILLVDKLPFTAELAGVADEQVRFTDAALGAHSLKDLVRLGNFVEPRRGPLWLLADGSLLVSELLDMSGENLNGQSLILGDVSIPVSGVAAVILRLPADAGRRDELIATVMRRGADTDRIVLNNGDQVQGAIESIGNESLTIVTDLGKPVIALAEVTAIAFNPSLTERPRMPANYLIVGLTDGSRLVADSFSSDGAEISFTMGGTRRAARSSALACLQVFGGRATYLSDLKELSYKHVPFLSLAWPLRKDESVSGSPLHVQHRRHLKGLGMHTASRVAYKLDGPYQEFQAEVAIDDSTEGKGSATCSVFVDDGSGKWQSRYTSPMVRGGDPPISVRVDLKGVKAISLLTDFADRGDTLDHVDWLDARLVK
jgi:hypothetical protein